MKPQPAAHSLSARRFATHTPPRLPSTSLIARTGRQAFTRPSVGVRRTNELGLGHARKFSTGGNPTADVLYNAPLILRAALDFLDCPSERVARQAKGWRKAVVAKGKIGLEGQRCCLPECEVASSAELFAQAPEEAEEGLELIIPVEPHAGHTVEMDLDAAGHTSLLSPELIAELNLRSSQQRRHWTALEHLLRFLREQDRLGRVHMVTLASHHGEQVFRVGVRQWTERELREALGMYETDQALWVDAVDWRVVHAEEECDFDSDWEVGCEDDLVYPTADSCSVWDVGWASSECKSSSSHSSGMGPASLLSDLGALRSPTFEAWSRL